MCAIRHNCKQNNDANHLPTPFSAAKSPIRGGGDWHTYGPCSGTGRTSEILQNYRFLTALCVAHTYIAHSISSFPTFDLK
jgi:hypothetical protein